MGCLRSSATCNIQECAQVGDGMVIPTDCLAMEDLGSEFEEYVFEKLVEGSSDVSARKAKVDSALDNLAQQLDSKDIASPFLNFMTSVGEQQETRTRAETYYRTVQTLEDLKPIVEQYIQSKMTGSDSGSAKDIINKIAYSSSVFLRCALARSFESEASTSSPPGTLAPEAAAAASFFVPLVGAQLRNDEVIKSLVSSGIGNSDIEDLSNYLGVDLPMSQNLKYDTRNWLFPQSAGPSGPDNVNSENSALPWQNLTKEEMSDKVGSKITLLNELFSILEIQTSRDDKELSDFMAASALFFLISDGKTPSSPYYITLHSGKRIPIVGPVAMAFPAASEFIPGLSASSNVLDPKSDPPASPNWFSKGSGGALNPVAPTDADIASVLYKAATLRFTVSSESYKDANSKVDPANFYILDLVSGDRIPSNMSQQMDQDVKHVLLEAQLEFGKGVWAGGWAGGGAFAVGVDNWEEGKSSAAAWLGMSRGRQDMIALFAWVVMGSILAERVF